MLERGGVWASPIKFGDLGVRFGTDVGLWEWDLGMSWYARMPWVSGARVVGVVRRPKGGVWASPIKFGGLGVRFGTDLGLAE